MFIYGSAHFSFGWKKNAKMYLLSIDKRIKKFYNIFFFGRDKNNPVKVYIKLFKNSF